MSRVPMGSDGGGQDGGNVRLRDRVYQVPQGISADLIATVESFTRDDVDAYAVRSQQRAATAQAEGGFMMKALWPEISALLLPASSHA